MLSESQRRYYAEQESRLRRVADEEGVTIWRHAGLWHLTATHCDVTARELWMVHERDIRRRDCQRADRYRR
ncbi:hypothetical protein [Aromatoleum evansii]|uniref:hypothetical protein n=1 Tax=Aromatoleum evansii TaxID=59406 RepID=UPI00145FBAC0|nr:hypothetical protein [Aromatoleum evansii]NMG32357.1 hypothetical protein [Aromatoleum evansii]